MMSTARDTLPEPLSGLREPAVVELPPGRPWLTLSELNRLILQSGFTIQASDVILRKTV